MKKVVKIVVAIGVMCLVQRFCHKQTDGFALGKIQSDLLPRKEWEVVVSEEEKEAAKRALGQEFRYLAKGAQSYVFGSADGKYVLKFFRHPHLQKNGKLDKDFESYKIAYDQMREETGLVYLHLNKTKDLGQKITIFDKIGVIHELDLDQMEFLLQKRACLIFSALERWKAEGNSEIAKQGISSLFHLLQHRCEKGIFDKDPDLSTNFGFYGSKAVQIDVGRFKILETQEPMKEEIVRITDHLHHWLNANYPELSPYFKELLDAIP